MPQNFLDIEKGNNFSNTWRNVFFIFILVLAIGGSFFAYVSFSPDSLKNKFSAKFAVSDVGVGAEGARAEIAVDPNAQAGDVVIEPPSKVTAVPQLPKIPELVGDLPDPKDLPVKSIIVKDHETGAVLYGKNQYERRSIASISKLMSAIVILEQNVEWSQTAQVVPDDVIDTHMYAGDTYSFEDLWNSALIGSSNKAVLTLVDKSRWSRDAFMQRMNERAVELGMRDTVFAEPTGLSSENISTASDIVLLLTEALRNNKIANTLLTKEYSIYSQERNKNHHMWSTNWLLLGWVPTDFDLFGGKTGYIDASGYNFTVRVGNKDGHILDIAVLGADSHESRFTVARDIAKAVFEAYNWPDISE